MLIQRVGQVFVEFDKFLEYSEGGLYWKLKPNKANKVIIGSRVGSIGSDGYRKFGFNRKYYREHRVIFYMHHGYWPKLIDHIDRNILNNNIDDLRDADPHLNAVNSANFNNFISYHNGRYEIRYKGSYVGSTKDYDEAMIISNSLLLQSIL